MAVVFFERSRQLGYGAMRPSSLFLLQVGTWSPTRAPRRGSLRRLRQPRPGNPRPAESGPRFPFPAPGRIRVGKRGFPVSRFRPSRESGVPSPFPGHIGNRGNGNWGLGFPGLGQPRARSSWQFRKLQVETLEPEGRLGGRIRIKSVDPIGQLAASARESVLR